MYWSFWCGLVRAVMHQLPGDVCVGQQRINKTVGSTDPSKAALMYLVWSGHCRWHGKAWCVWAPFATTLIVASCQPLHSITGMHSSRVSHQNRQVRTTNAPIHHRGKRVNKKGMGFCHLRLRPDLFSFMVCSPKLLLETVAGRQTDIIKKSPGFKVVTEPACPDASVESSLTT